MQKLTLTNHSLADLEVPLSKEEWLALKEAVQVYARQHGYPFSCGDDDKEFFKILFAKLELLESLDTDNPLQHKPDIYALEMKRALKGGEK
jgi:hypothetical protein